MRLPPPASVAWGLVGRERTELDVSNPTYGQSSDPRASGGSSAAGVPDPYASDQTVPSDPYTSDQTVPSDPYTSDQTVPSDPYTSDQTVPSDPYTSDQTVPSDPYTS